MKRWICACAALSATLALWSPAQGGAAPAPAPIAHHATLGPLATTALSASAHGQRLPAAWLVGRATKRGTTYGVFLRGSTTASAIAATGAVPGTVLSVGATADATLSELHALAALPGVTEVELAGQAGKQLDQSVPAIHASEPGHASAAGVPHMWSGTGGSADAYVTTQGGSVLWQQSGACPPAQARVPVLTGGTLYARNPNTGNEMLAASNGQSIGVFTADLAPAFDGSTGFYVSGGVLTARDSSGNALWTFSGDGTPNSAPITAPIVANGNVFVGATSGKVFALPETGSGANTPTWTGHAGVPILPINSGGSEMATLGLGAGGGMLIVPATGHLVAFGDATVTSSSDTVTSYQIDAAHDGDQPSDSLTSPLAAAPKWDDNLGAYVSYPLIVGGLVYVVVSDDNVNGATALYALNESDGSVAWGPITIAGSGQEELAYDSGRIFTMGSSAQAFDATTGALDWTQASLNQGYFYSAPVASNGVVYITGAYSGGLLYALSAFTGAVIWGDPTNAGGNTTLPAVSDAGVYVSMFGCIEAFAPAIVHAPALPTFAGDTGQGTVVGIVDTGLDLANEDFRTNSGTRVVDVWDQIACPNPSANACPAQPPNSQGYDYGAECSQAAINAAMCGPFYYGNWCTQPVGTSGTTATSWPEGDCDGHGTHVAGIAASNGRAAPWGTYIGVAPQSDLVIVKSDENLADIIDGVAYVFKVAAARGEPASVNISLGTNEGPHDGSDMFETMLDALTGPGKLVTVAGGNEATNNPTYHYHASAVVADGQVRTDGLLVEQMPVFIDLWYPGNQSISAAVSVTGEGQSPWVSPDTTGVSGEDGTCVQGIPNQDEFTDPVGNIFEILSCTHMPSNGMNEIQVAMFNPLTGSEESLDSPANIPCSDSSCLNVFHVLLRGNSASTGVYNAWTFNQGDYFFYKGDGNDNSTLDEPASAHDVISVGSYVTRNSWPSLAGTESDSSVVGAISSFSGHGPTLDGRSGIDIVAPGEEIGSSLSAMGYQPDGVESDCPAGTPDGCISPDGNHLFLQGTSMAAPHVAGALALLLEQQPTIDVAQAKSLLAQSANRSPLASGGATTTWGAGKLELGPGVLAVNAREGPLTGGNTIDITGVDLQPGVSMSLGARPLTLTNIGSNEWSAPVPAAAEAGAVSLTITNPDGSAAVDPSAYVYLDPTAYHSLTPFRICDTRPQILTNQCEGKTLGTRGSINVQITGGAVPAGARAVVINLTAVSHSTGATVVIAYPAGGTVPLASNINLNGSGARANLVVVQLSSAGQVTIFNAAGIVDVIADVQGYFAAPTGSKPVPGEFHSIPPLRICDTRAGMNTECAGATDHALLGGQWRDVVLSGLPPGAPGGTPSIPSDGTAAAAVFNLTAVGGTQATYLTVEPPSGSDACPSRAPSSSNVNPQPGTALPNRVISPLGPKHDVCVFNSVGSIDFIIDVDGWFGNGSESTPGALFNSVAPTRICDTRAGSPTDCAGMPLEPNAANTIPVAGVHVMPTMVAGSPPVAVVVNLTAVAGSASTYFTLYPSNVAHPRASDLNPVAGEVIANLSIVGIAQTGSAAGEVSLYNAAGTINAILDVAGWFQ